MASKILEIIVHKQLVKNKNQHIVLTEVQSAFRGHRSTATTLTKITDGILRHVDENKITLL